MNIFVLNCGSSSIKWQIIETDLELIERHADRCLAKGLIERIGSQALISFKVNGKTHKDATPLRDHKTAISYIINWISSDESGIPGISSLDDIHAVGHRTVHGGETFSRSVRIDDEVMKEMQNNIELAPLHNPANIRGIQAAKEVFGPSIPQVAIFDTAFHTASMPEANYLYAIPYQYYRRYKIRKYGFHGTSHRYLAYRYRTINELSKEDTNIITLHLGNGASACAIKGGRSIDTSMGFTPLEGLVMGTRCGDIDPSVIEFLMHKDGYSVDEAFAVLNKRSGILGISGLTNDMRDLLEEESEHNDRRASLAIDMFCGRIKKYVGAYMAEMNGTDAIAFTGGIGENSPDIRKRSLQNMENLGIIIDDEKNNNAPRGAESKISADDSKIEVYVLPTNEELILARDTCRVVLNAPTP